MNIYQFDDYREFVNNWISLQNQRGARLRLAQAAHCSPSWMTRVLAGDVQMTPDQAMGISLYMQLNDSETDYFLLLVDVERAATRPLKNKIKNKLKNLKKESRSLQSSLRDETAVSQEHAVCYYSSWIYAAIHVACMIRPHTTNELASRFHIKEETIVSMSKELRDMGLLTLEQNGYSATSKSVHLPADHPASYSGHIMWRGKVIQDLQEKCGEELHYSGLHCLSAKDIETVQRKLKEAVLECRSIIQESPAEAAAVLCLDWYTI